MLLFVLSVVEALLYEGEHAMVVVLIEKVAITGLVLKTTLSNTKRIVETIALCSTRCVIIDIQSPSFTRVNSLHLQSQCLAKAVFCKATQKNKFHLFFWRPCNGLITDD